MARATPEVIAALRTTAARLDAGAPYQWGHAGMCNCGHLAQTVTQLPKAEIYREVAGEWSEYLEDRCPLTGAHVDDLAAAMERFGFAAGELVDLERLSDPTVLRALPGGHRWLDRNQRDDVVIYLRAWADLLESQRRSA